MSSRVVALVDHLIDEAEHEGAGLGGETDEAKRDLIAHIERLEAEIARLRAALETEHRRLCSLVGSTARMLGSGG